MQHTDFDEVKEIGAGGYGIVYTAKYKKYLESSMPETVVLKRFKNFVEMPELFISEVSQSLILLIKMIFNLTLYLLLFNSSEIIQSVCIMISLKFMELHKTRKQKST